jgi:hypothetical protein
VNPSAECVAANKPYDPKDEKNDCDCPKHFVLLDDFGFYVPGSL